MPISHRASKQSSAFSLVEILVVIGLIGLLLAILIPALAGARGTARQTVCLSNLSGIAQVLEHYEAQYSVLPFTTRDGPLFTSPDQTSSVSFDSPWKLTTYWPSTMFDVAPWREYFAAWVCPGSDRPEGKPWIAPNRARGWPSYSYVRSFQASPRLFRADAVADDALLLPVRSTQVTYPASKVIMYDTEMAHLPPSAKDKDSRPMLFADSHASIERVSKATSPGVNPYEAEPEPLHDTPMGAAGRDY